MAFEFTGKIDSATFVDRENTIIEVLFKREDKLHVYHLPVDYGAPDFQGFLSEWSLEAVERETRVARRLADEAFDKMIQGRVAEELAKGQRLLDEQDKRRYAIAQKTLDKQDKERYEKVEAYKKKLEADVDKTDKERYEKVEAYKKELEADVDKIDKERYEKVEAYKKKLEEDVAAIDKARYKKVEAYKKKLEADVDKTDKERYQLADAYKKQLEAEVDKTDKERYELVENYKKKLEADADEIDKERYELAEKYKQDLENKVDKNEQERIELWRLNNPISTPSVVPADLLMNADKFNDNKNFLFDLKLAMFEDPTIAAIKDKATKLSIRKAKSIYEVLEIYCKIKRLQSE